MKILLPHLLLCLSTYRYHLSCDQVEQDLKPVITLPCQVTLLADVAPLVFTWGPVPGDLHSGLPSEYLNFCWESPPSALTQRSVLNYSSLS